ncbi:hypothetical protein [Lactococcus lactis]|uniref:hypothetical protein n=1 Tax=Lactococcus lactis TaxID=1358 RepID=UPI0005135AD6|nr:hypothetical protein [Lactococcus lactis]KGF75942.1 hypothetical protein Llab_2079 [Lactococcus lactis]
MKKKYLIISNSSLEIINNTLTILPFIIFLKLSVNRTFPFVLPFVVFYALMTTGIFCIRGIKIPLNSSSILEVSIFCGLVGSLVGILGSIIPTLYTLSGFFLGISAAWLPTSYKTIKLFNYKDNFNLNSNSKLKKLFFLILGLALVLPYDKVFISFFAIYTFLYLFTFPIVKAIKQWYVYQNNLEYYSYWYFVLFLIFFALIFYLRSSRLLMSIIQFDYFINGCLILIILLIIFKVFFYNIPHRKTSFKLRYMSILNGALNTYLFMFTSIYVSGYYGNINLVYNFYLPYILGIIIAPKIENKLIKNRYKILVIILIFGFILMFLKPLYSFGILVLSTGNICLSNVLNNIYMKKNRIANDKKIWIKNTIQSTGGIVYQCILMIIGSLLVSQNNFKINELFIAISQKFPSDYSRSLVVNWNCIAIIILLLNFLLALFIEFKYDSVNLK